MTPTMLREDTILVDDEVRVEAEKLIDEVCDTPVTGVLVTFNGVSSPLPPALARFLVNVLERTAEGGTLTVQSMPEELTTTVAARMLGVSRPTLMKWIAAGDITAVKVGSHSRLRSQEVLAFKQQRDAARRSTFDDLRATADELGDL
ncbi:helix-turn-helix domain-containing protein [Glaciibacter psychrotolerans]|uniref:Excisionase family DNA binding protein n=1 Tax=Glaciibacter psychrotolerans TaxID=670054 RepID=A0A7Z0ED36_9MICO|nr:helix-turn-helix domain-containing protein [Leifsonia psychrotolerans]NYJ18722.1 excisionase family DNA binding protein [Leifsonia psychrotolerans]